MHASNFDFLSLAIPTVVFLDRTTVLLCANGRSATYQFNDVEVFFYFYHILVLFVDFDIYNAEN